MHYWARRMIRFPILSSPRCVITDLVKVALIAAAPSVIAAVLGFFNRAKLAAVDSKVSDVAINVDGNLSELKRELADLSAAYLALTKQASHAEGVLQQKEEET
jgi:hypothetical protein